MRKKAFIILTLSIFLLCNLAACSVTDKFTPEPRVFQEKPFSSDAWIKGDAHARGEMALDLSRYETFESLLDGKNQSELLKLLGEPDKKTTGRCCYVRDTDEVEVWLYRIQLPAERGGQKPEEYAIQIYFDSDGRTVTGLERGTMQEKPVYIPRVG